MQRRLGFIFGIGATVVLGLIAGSARVQAAHSTYTKFGGTTSGNGKIDRTIIDAAPQPGPNGTTGAQATYTVSCTVPAGLTPSQVASRFTDSCNVQLPNPPFVASLCDPTKVHLFKNTGSYTVSDVNTVPNITMALEGPCAGPGPGGGAPALSPTGLAALVAGLSALAYWQRRRRGGL